MTVVLTGGTGLIGAAVLRALVDSGHEVTALVRSDASAATVAAAGATAAIGDLGDERWLGEQLAACDGAIHTASPGDAGSADFDAGVVRVALAAFAGTDRPYVHTGGVWVYGAGTGITESSAFDPPALTAWRSAVEDQVLGADGLRGVVVEPGIVHGGGAGLATLITHPDSDGRIRLIGEGSQHWATVHAADVADLYVRALDNRQARGYYIGSSRDSVTVRQIGEAAAAAGHADVVEESDEASRERLFAPLVDALLLDQVIGEVRAYSELGWEPSGPTLLEEIASGAYAG